MPIISGWPPYGGMAEWTKATVLKTVVLRPPVNEWLGLMKEAPRLRGFSRFSGPPSGSLGGGYWWRWGCGCRAGWQIL